MSKPSAQHSYIQERIACKGPRKPRYMLTSRTDKNDIIHQHKKRKINHERTENTLCDLEIITHGVTSNSETLQKYLTESFASKQRALNIEDLPYEQSIQFEEDDFDEDIEVYSRWDDESITIGTKAIHSFTDYLTHFQKIFWLPMGTKKLYAKHWDEYLDEKHKNEKGVDEFSVKTWLGLRDAKAVLKWNSELTSVSIQVGSKCMVLNLYCSLSISTHSFELSDRYTSIKAMELESIEKTTMEEVFSYMEHCISSFGIP
jgi:hypothetical protein